MGSGCCKLPPKSESLQRQIDSEERYIAAIDNGGWPKKSKGAKKGIGDSSIDVGKETKKTGKGEIKGAAKGEAKDAAAESASDFTKGARDSVAMSGATTCCLNSCAAGIGSVSIIDFLDLDDIAPCFGNMKTTIYMFMYFVSLCLTFSCMFYLAFLILQFIFTVAIVGKKNACFKFKRGLARIAFLITCVLMYVLLSFASVLSPFTPCVIMSFGCCLMASRSVYLKKLSIGADKCGGPSFLKMTFFYIDFRMPIELMTDQEKDKAKADSTNKIAELKQKLSQVAPPA